MMEESANEDFGTLRVVLKDMGSLILRDNLRPGKISVLVDRHEVISAIISDQDKIQKEVSEVMSQMRNDKFYEVETRQINQQVAGVSKALFYKFPGFDFNADNDIVILEED